MERMYHIEEKLGTFKEGRVSAAFIKYTLERIRHPVTRDHLSVCLICTKTGQNSRDTDHIDSLDRLLAENIPEIDAHIIVAPEYSYHQETKPLTEKQKEHYLQRQRRTSAKTNALVIPGTFVWATDGKLLNAAYLLHQGEIMGQYLKRRDGGDGNFADDFGLDYLKGETPGLFTWNGLRLGIEICADAGSLARDGVIDRDLLLIASCGIADTSSLQVFSRCVALNTSGCLRNGGYGFVTDGYVPSVHAYRKEAL